MHNKEGRVTIENFQMPECSLVFFLISNVAPTKLLTDSELSVSKISRAEAEEAPDKSTLLSFLEKTTSSGPS